MQGPPQLGCPHLRCLSGGVESWCSGSWGAAGGLGGLGWLPTALMVLLCAVVARSPAPPRNSPAIFGWVLALPGCCPPLSWLFLPSLPSLPWRQGAVSAGGWAPPPPPPPAISRRMLGPQSWGWAAAGVLCPRQGPRCPDPPFLRLPCPCWSHCITSESSARLWL